MYRRIWAAIGGLTAALIIAALAIATRPAAAQQATQTPIRSVTVVGQGEVKAAPDTAIVTIGVETDGKTAKEALASNTQNAAAVQKKLTDLGIAAKDIQTSGFNIYPTYASDGRQLTGFHVSNQVTVKIRSLDKTGTLLDQVVQVGANSISGISFTVDSPRALEDQARQAAMQDAKARADLLARSAGASVGDVLIITENIGSTPPVPMAARAAVASDAAGAVPVQAGEMTIAISVQVTYTLK